MGLPVLLLKLCGAGGPGSARHRAERTLPVRKLSFPPSPSQDAGSARTPDTGAGRRHRAVPLPACLRNAGQPWLPRSPPTRRMCVTGAERQTACTAPPLAPPMMSVAAGAAPFADQI